MKERRLAPPSLVIYHRIAVRGMSGDVVLIALWLFEKNVSQSADGLEAFDSVNIASVQLKTLVARVIAINKLCSARKLGSMHIAMEFQRMLCCVLRLLSVANPCHFRVSLVLLKENIASSLYCVNTQTHTNMRKILAILREEEAYFLRKRAEARKAAEQTSKSKKAHE